MLLLDFVRRCAARVLRSRAREPLSAHEPPLLTQAASGSDIRAFLELPGQPGPVSALPADALLEWENREAPSLSRRSDAAEALSDEKQDLRSSLNFPLHWTTPRESWDYLFDFAVACLGPGPTILSSIWPREPAGRRNVSTGWASELFRWISRPR